MAVKRTIIWFLFMAAVVLFCPKSVSAQRTLSGTCGPSANWSVNPDTKVLTIRGTGAVTERIPLRVADWNGYLFGNPYVEQIVIEEGITSIDAARPFLYVQYAKQISLPNSLRRISDSSFCDLNGIQDIMIPAGVTEIGDAVFVKCFRLKNITVASSNPSYCSVDGVLYTKDQRCLLAFPTNKKVQNDIFTVPETVREIAPMAFAQQKKIREVVLPERLEKLGGGAFCGCNKLKKINLQDTAVQELPDFNGWEIELPNESVDNRDEEPEDIWHPEKASYCWGTFAGTNIQTLILPDAIREISTWCIWGAQIHKLYLGTSYAGSINAYYTDVDFYIGATEGTSDNINDKCMMQTLNLRALSELTEIEAAEENSHYMVKNNVLYSKDGTIAYGYPYGKKILEVVLEKSVKHIAPFAFARKDGILIITCQGSLTSIGAYAFYHSGVMEFRVNGNVAHIEDHAFFLSDLEKFSVSGDVYSIGDHAFDSCEYLRDAELQVGRQLYEVTSTSFFHRISLQRIKKILVPDFSARTHKKINRTIDEVVEKWQKIQEINKNQDYQCGDNAYGKIDGKILTIYGSGNISKKINLPDEEAKRIRKIVIEEGITGITGQKVFENLGDPRQVKLPDSLETIAPFAFTGITQMHKIQIPRKVSRIGEGAFYGIFCLENILVDPNNATYTSVDGVVYTKDMQTLIQFPEGKELDRTQQVENCGFPERIYDVPDSVTEIAPLAFAGTKALQIVVLPKTLQILGGGAFYGSGIERINLQDTQVTELPPYNGWKWKVRGDYPDEKEQMPEEEVYYYWGTFEQSRLYHLVLPDRVKAISSVCIRNSDVHQLTLGASYCGLINQREISMAVYHGEENGLKISQHTLAEDLLSYSNMDTLLLYQYLQEELEVVISQDNPYYQIRNGVIYNKEETIAYGLSSRMWTDVILEDTVKEIAPTAFWGETYLQSITVPKGLQNIGAGAFAESGLRVITVNGTVQTIQEGAFAGSKLEYFKSGGVICVEDCAFSHTYLSEIDLGQQIQYLGKGVFRDCYVLQDVFFRNVVLWQAPDLCARCPSLRSIGYRLQFDVTDFCFRGEFMICI